MLDGGDVSTDSLFSGEAGGPPPKAEETVASGPGGPGGGGEVARETGAVAAGAVARETVASGAVAAGGAGGVVEFDSKTIGNNPYMRYLSINTGSDHPPGKILIQNTPEIQSVLSHIQIIKKDPVLLKNIDDAVNAAIKLIIPLVE